MSNNALIRDLVEEILESDRTLEDVCSGYPELLWEVRKQLQRAQKVEARLADLFPASSDGLPAARSAQSLLAGDLPEIPGYQVEAVIGHGGMGVVMRARHLKLNRLTALKMLLSGAFASGQERSRFIREAEAIAALQHPHIVQIYDVGELERRPYFTMELLDGGNLAQQLVGAPQSALRSAQLVETLAGAVEFAHQHGIVHRDLKPANILLAPDGTPKIADFGLAHRADLAHELTISGSLLGTPSYMAPEQANGKSNAAGPLIDVYALGAILYEMLTGRPPFRAATPLETQRQVINEEPVRPSRLNASVPCDLETICLKCLQKDPARRYASASALADDLTRFLEGKPVLARPIGRLERTWLWAKRNRTVAAALSMVSLLLLLIVLGSIGAATYFRSLEDEQRKLAQEKGQLADEKGSLLVEKEDERSKAVAAEKRETMLRRQSDAQRESLRDNLYLSQMNIAGQAAQAQNGLVRVSDLLAPWANQQPDLRNWEWYYLNSLGQRSLSTRLAHLRGVYTASWNSGGTRLASAGMDRTICIWNETDAEPLLRLKGHTDFIMSVSWAPDGERLASVGFDRMLRVWQTQTGEELYSAPGHSGGIRSVAWSPDGRTIATASEDQTIQLWKASSGSIEKTLRGHVDAVVCVAWSPDSRWLASAAHDATVGVWDVTTGEVRKLTGHRNWVNQVAWSPDGTRIASGSNDQTFCIWNAENSQEVLRVRAHLAGVTSVSWSPDGGHLASASDDYTVKVWSAVTGNEEHCFRGHTAPLTSVAWSPQGTHIASAAYDSTLRIWDAANSPESLVGHNAPATAIAWHPSDSTLLASADDNGFVKIWDVPQRPPRWARQGDSHHVHSLAWEPAGSRLAAGSGNGLIRIWQVGSASNPDVLEAYGGDVYSVAWSPDGRCMASGSHDGTIRIWDPQSKQIAMRMSNHEISVRSVAWRPDGKRLASASVDGTVRIWNVSTGEEIHCCRGPVSPVTTVTWSPDGAVVASAGDDQTIYLWDPDTGHRIMSYRGHSSHVIQLTWSPDGTRLISASKDGVVKIWDVKTGKEALTLPDAPQLNAIAISPDGMILASAGEDRLIRIHDATTGYVAGRAPQLLPWIDRQLSADPRRSDVWQLRGSIHAGQGSWTQAGADFDRYLSLAGNRSWLMLDASVAGPFSADLAVHCPPEDFDPFDKEESVTHGVDGVVRVGWQKVQGSSQGMIDFSPLMDYQNEVSAYAWFPIYSSNRQQVAILVGSDDQAVAWLNGKRLYESLSIRSAIPDEDAALATLRPGWNALLVRVANEVGEHGLYLRLSNSAEDLARAAGHAR